MSEEPGKYIPDFTAMFDQFGTSMENFALVLKQYHSKLIQEGFSPAVAMLLIKDFQAKFLDHVFSPGKQK